MVSLNSLGYNPQLPQVACQQNMGIHGIHHDWDVHDMSFLIAAARPSCMLPRENNRWHACISMCPGYKYVVYLAIGAWQTTQFIHSEVLKDNFLPGPGVNTSMIERDFGREMTEVYWLRFDMVKPWMCQ